MAVATREVLSVVPKALNKMGIETETSGQADPVTETKEQTESVGEVRDADAEPIREKQEPIDGEEQVKFRVSSILREVEMNFAIAAAAPWTEKLSPFQTDVWDAAGDEVDYLPANYQYELAEAYADIHLANRIVGLSMEIGRRSKDLDETYIRICARIAERLKRVNPGLEG